MVCEKCSYQEASGKEKEFEGRKLCSICFHFLPEASLGFFSIEPSPSSPELKMARINPISVQFKKQKSFLVRNLHAFLSDSAEIYETVLCKK